MMMVGGTLHACVVTNVWLKRATRQSEHNTMLTANDAVQ